MAVATPRGGAPCIPSAHRVGQCLPNHFTLWGYVATTVTLMVMVTLTDRLLPSRLFPPARGHREHSREGRASLRPVPGTRQPPRHGCCERGDEAGRAQDREMGLREGNEVA